MAGDGETEVLIGSVFLATAEANKILEQFHFNPDVQIALSDKIINVTELMDKSKIITKSSKETVSQFLGINDVTVGEHSRVQFRCCPTL